MSALLKFLSKGARSALDSPRDASAVMTQASARVRRLLPWLLVAAMPMSSASAQALEAVAETPLVKISDYLSTKQLTLSNGDVVEQTIIHGPPKPPAEFAMARPMAAAGVIEKAVQQATMLGAPAYTWVYGCSAVSGSMIAAYYDRNGYPDMYTGATNGGVMPMNDDSWPTWTDSAGASYPSNPLIASRNGVDGRATRGSIEDYWVLYNSTANDPYITNSWTQHTYGDAIGDYMFTSQSAKGNSDGSTTFWSYSSSSKLTCSTMASSGYNDGTLGRKNFYEARGYTVADCYNQKTDNIVSGGFSFAQYQAEIDAGNPVMLNLAGHTVVGVGYDAAANTVYLHDTWDTSVHTMTWGTSYSGMALQSVSIVQLTASGSGSYSLNVNSSGVNGVVMAASPASFAGVTSYSVSGIAPGTTIMLTAPASSGGATFANWSGCDGATGVNCTLTMYANKNVTANYSVPQTPLTNGGSVPLSGAAKSAAYYTIAVPTGASNLVVSIAGGTGDADMYVRQGSLPTTSAYDCRPFISNNNESCSFASPAAGTWYIMVYGYSAFASATLTASYDYGGHTLTVSSSGAAGVSMAASSPAYAGTTNYAVTGIVTGIGITLVAPSVSGGANFVAWAGCDSVAGANCNVTMTANRTVTAAYLAAGAGQLLNGVPVMLSGATGAQDHFYAMVPAGASGLSFSLSGGTGDADMYVRQGAAPTLTVYDCRPYVAGNSETCNFTTPSAGYWYVMLNGYSAYSGVSLVASYTAPPGSPAITSIVPGHGQLTVAFSAPHETGGAAITGYAATCEASGRTTRTATGTASPLVVRSLVPGVSYGCFVTATNGTGLTGPASAAVAGIPDRVGIVPILMLLN
jgi:hypothetical protein